MVQLIKEESQPKHLQGKLLTLEDFFQLTKDYVSAVNSGAIPQIQNSL